MIATLQTAAQVFIVYVSEAYNNDPYGYCEFIAFGGERPGGTFTGRRQAVTTAETTELRREAARLTGFIPLRMRRQKNYTTIQNWRFLVKVSWVMNVYDQPAYTNHLVRKDIILKLGGA
ncbi:MAG: hypothetical protein GY800_08530 [Planctomycetes bacterium]|nr:hypothetical protein [Planctomycetota bacterium]